MPIKFKCLQHSSTLNVRYDLNCVESAITLQSANHPVMLEPFKRNVYRLQMVEGL